MSPVGNCRVLELGLTFLATVASLIDGKCRDTLDSRRSEYCARTRRTAFTAVLCQSYRKVYVVPTDVVVP